MSKSERTRHYIIEQVSSLFNKHGYAGTSLSQITEVIGLTKGAVYGNFGSKEEIALEALQYNFDQISDAIGREMKKYENSCDRLAVLASYYEEHYKIIDQGGGCPVINAATENDDGNPVLKEMVVKLIDFWEASIRRTIERGIKRREIKDNINIAYYSALFIELIEGGIMLAKITGKEEYLSKAVQHLKDVINNDLKL